MQFLPRRHLPGKALNLLDEAGARVMIRRKPGDVTSKPVTGEDIEELVAERALVPIERVRKDLGAIDNI
jgi:ATP-dependent Clp protease ATP-binding subunit ClpA